jgi:transposase
MSVASLPDLNALPGEALRALILAQHEQLLSTESTLTATQEQLQSREREIEHLKLLLAKLHRMQFGRKSEKLTRQIEQLELRLEELESQRSEQEPDAPEPAPVTAASIPAAAKPTRRGLPDHLPRQTRKHDPKETVCPECQGELRKLGEDISEMLEYVPASFAVIRHVRTKLSCTKCDCIVQAEAPSRPIARGVAGPGLLAHVLVSKYCDHLPLYRQSEMYARQDVELERSTLADWVGGSAQLLEPLVEALRRYVMVAGKLHADDTPVPVLAPGQGKTKTGRLWTYVRDDRPAGNTAASAVWFAYSPDRKGEHPERHLEKFRGTLQADAYAGFNQLYENGRIAQAACWAHVRRKFYDLEQAHASPVAREALQRIGTLYGIEEQIRGCPPEERREVRQAQAQPLLDSLRQWFEATLSKLSRKSETTAAIRYALVRWDALVRYIEDGHIEIGRVEMWRGGVGLAYLFPALSVAGASLS